MHDSVRTPCGSIPLSRQWQPGGRLALSIASFLAIVVGGVGRISRCRIGKQSRISNTSHPVGNTSRERSQGEVGRGRFFPDTDV